MNPYMNVVAKTTMLFSY
jgi:hypothetical protein